jgi:hypothetical protein
MHYNFINIVIHDNFIMAQPNLVLSGEIYGKQTSNKFVMYNVLKVSKPTNGKPQAVTLQNIDNPLSLFETTAQKLSSSGYVRISQTPYINTEIKGLKKKAAKKPLRCPYTLDFLEARADSERPAAVLPDLFATV